MLSVTVQLVDQGDGVGGTPAELLQLSCASRLGVLSYDLRCEHDGCIECCEM
ncbi:MAG: hypothetical protein J5943_04240 [Oribacterium sp.]|nr:hypothetical protein [Oribacterium sp.]